MDPLTGSYLAIGDHRVPDPRCRLCRVAGTTHAGEALQDARFAPGSALALRPDPANPHDADAVGVWDAGGEAQVGWVSAADAPEVGGMIRGGQALSGIVLREFRSAPDGPRIALNMVVGPAGELALEVVPEW
ncbi:MAG: HIRAN domain-containing protein [Solirubrobacteraceae bacterium]